MCCKVHVAVDEKCTPLCAGPLWSKLLESGYWDRIWIDDWKLYSMKNEQLEHLLGFIDTLFPAHRSTIAERRSYNLSESSCEATSVKIFKSLANCNVLTETTSRRSLVKILKRQGPNKEPWVTPEDSKNRVDFEQPTLVSNRSSRKFMPTEDQQHHIPPALTQG